MKEWDTMLEAKWSLLLCAWASTVLGFTWLALAMDVHWKHVFRKAAPATPFTRTALRCMGVVGLLVSLGLCLLADHPSMAALVWIMLLAGSVVSVALLLAWQPAMLRIAWPVAKASI
jgi:hypothetical protein